MKKDRKQREKLPSSNLKRETKSHFSISKPVSDVFDLVQKRTKLTRQQEERYRSIVETANEGIWEINKEARTIFINHRMAEMLGYTVEEMLGRSVFDFLFPEDYPE